MDPGRDPFSSNLTHLQPAIPTSASLEMLSHLQPYLSLLLQQATVSLGSTVSPPPDPSGEGLASVMLSLMKEREKLGEVSLSIQS